MPTEDEPSFRFPDTASALREIPDEELAEAWRRHAYDANFTYDRMAEQEFLFRHVIALKGFKRAADRSSNVLIGLTVVLVILTAAVVWLTFRLD